MAENKLYKIYRYWIMLEPDPKPWSYVGNTSLSLYDRAGGLTGRKYIEKDSKFSFAIETYGWPNFQREILEDGLTEEEAWKREQYWIQEFNSIEHGWNIAKGGKGVLGVSKHLSEEHKKKITESQRVFGVLQYDLNGNFIKEYPSIHEASRQTGTTRSNINSCLTGHRKTAGGFYWAKLTN